MNVSVLTQIALPNLLDAWMTPDTGRMEICVIYVYYVCLLFTLPLVLALGGSRSFSLNTRIDRWIKK